MTEPTHSLVDLLELVAQHSDDPSGLVYEELYRRHPDMQSLFALDTDGSVRGSMFEQAIECLLDFESGGSMYRVVLSTEQTNHDSYGVPSNIFRDFFDCMGTVFAKLVGEEWTSTHAAVWTAKTDEVFDTAV